MSEFPADPEESVEPGESEEAGESEVQPLSSAATMIPTEVRARVIREWGRLRFIIELLDTGAIHVDHAAHCGHPLSTCDATMMQTCVG